MDDKSKNDKYIGLTFMDGYKCRVAKDMTNKLILSSLTQDALFAIDCDTGKIIKNRYVNTLHTMRRANNWPVCIFVDAASLDEFLKRHRKKYRGMRALIIDENTQKDMNKRKEINANEIDIPFSKSDKVKSEVRVFKQLDGTLVIHIPSEYTTTLETGPDISIIKVKE